jgi:cytochrome c-type biogenesis protein CcmH/NrfF
MTPEHDRAAACHDVLSRRLFLMRALAVAGGVAGASALAQEPASCAPRSTSATPATDGEAAIADVDENDLREVTSNILCEGKCGKTVYTGEFADGCEIATRMKAQAAEYLAQGMTPPRVLEQFAADFGEGVFAAPPKEGSDLVVWLAPIVGLGVGAVVVAKAAATWRRNTTAVASALSPEADDTTLRRIDEEIRRDF